MVRMLVVAVLVFSTFLFCGGCKEEGDIFLIPSDRTAPTTTALPPGWTYTSVQRVVLFANEPATIYYTTDGTDPTTSSTVYSAPIDITSSRTLKFFAEDEVDNTEAIQTEIYIVTNWTAPVNISNTDPNWSFFSSVTVDTSGIARVAWEEDIGGGNREIFYATSSDWPGTKVNISNTSDSGYEPSIAVDSSNISYVAWTENTAAVGYEILLANSSNWTGSRANITNTADASLQVEIAIDSSNVIHTAWVEIVGGTTREIYYANSSNWATTTNISNSGFGSHNPSIAIDASDNIHVTWRENDTGGYDICYANSTDWSGTRTNVSNTTDNSWDPSITVDSNGIAYIVWRESIGGGASNEIYYANSTDWAATQKNVSATTDYSYYPEVAVDVNNVIHLVWADNVGGSNMEIFYTNSIDWLGNQVNISNSPEDCDYPDISIGSDHIIYMTWRERVGVPYEIFYVNSGS